MYTIFFGCAIGAGVIGGWFLRKQKEVTPSIIRQNSGDYKFIKPVLLYRVPEDTDTSQLQSLKREIATYIDSAKHTGAAVDVSVYFRQLSKDKWVGVNQDQKYSPASMFKVVSLISFLREVQQNHFLYMKKIMIRPVDTNKNINQDFYPPKKSVMAGETYTAAQLLSTMIIDSDNTAANTINNAIGAEAFNQTLKDLELPIPAQGDPIDTFSPHMYSRIFRSLYNGGFLSDDVSEQALKLMSKTTFNIGLVAGVPEGTVVSHKFGERSFSENGNVVHELHDCGIVYSENDPYFLCVMTKGDDFIKLQKVISDISTTAWNSLNQLDSVK
ncbi:MAG: serine hydrolase [Candidatus Paceibacterota bacterium]